MLNRWFLSVLIVTSAFTLIFGQTPQAKKEDKPDKQDFTFFYDGDGSYLGVQTSEVTKDNFAKLRLKDVRGVAIDRVMENSPAAAAGLQAGDVIVRFNGEEVTSTRKLNRLIAEVDPDHQAKVTVIRDGSERELTATLAKRPGFHFDNGSFNFDLPDFKGHFDNMPKINEQFREQFKEQFKDNFKGEWKDNFKFDLQNMMPDLKDLPQFKGDWLKDLPDLKNLPQGNFHFELPDGYMNGFSWNVGGRTIGVGVTSLSKQLAEHFGVQNGVMIDEVRENSPAAKAGLKAGDIIVEADGAAVSGDHDLVKTINKQKQGDIQLTIVRDGKRQTVTVTPEVSKDGGWIIKNDENSKTPPPTNLFRTGPAMNWTGPGSFNWRRVI